MSNLNAQLLDKNGNILFPQTIIEQITNLSNTLATFVTKVDGKGLSANDFTNTLLTKLNSLENYDDAELRNSISSLQTRLDTLVNGSASTAIDTFNEIVNFLSSISDTTTLEGIIAGINDAILAEKNRAIAAENAIKDSLIPQTFSDVVFTNPSSKGIVPRKIGDTAGNSTTLEVWESVALANDPSSWVLKSAGKYGGTLIADFNAPNISGVNTSLNTAANAPNNTENWYCLHMNSNKGVASAVQIAIGFTTGKIYQRLKINSVYGSWIGGVSSTELSNATGLNRNIQLQFMENLGCLNFSSLSDTAKIAVNSIKSIEIVVDDSISSTANIRLYGVWNGDVNPTTALVFKDYTTSDRIVQLNRTSGVNTGVLNLSGTSSDGLLSVKATIDLSALPVNFGYYEDSSTTSILFSVKKLSETSVKKYSLDSEISSRKKIIEDNFISFGLLNKDNFFTSDSEYQIAEAITELEIVVDDSIASTANIRLYGVWNSDVNPTTALVFKDFTTSDRIVILNRTSGVNTGILNLSGTSYDGLISVKATVNLDRITYPFQWYQDNTTYSASFSVKKLSETNIKKVTFDNRLEVIENSAPSFSQVDGTDEIQNGYYDVSTGIFTAYSNYKSRKFDILKDVIYFATSRVSGGATALVCYYNDNIFICSQFVGVDEPGYTQYTRQLLTIPDNANKIGISSFGDTAYYGALEKKIFAPISESQVDTKLLSYSKIQKSGKKFAWFGTSIPAEGIWNGTSYPHIIAQNLNSTCYNESVGSSCVRAGGNNTNTPTKCGLLKGLYSQPLLRSLSHTIVEKQQLMDHWQTGLDSFGNVTEGGTYGYRDFQCDYLSDWSTVFSANDILGFSYENKIIKKYLDSTSPSFIAKPDYFVLDHGHNDLVQTEYDISDAAAISVPETRNDRTTFIGAMNYIIDEMLKYDARLRIVFIGHYENARKPRIYQAQLNLFDYWDFPSLKLWEKMGWSQQTVQTHGYWSSGVWYPTGGALQTMTITQIWMNDDLHPGTIEARNLIAKNIIPFIENVN